jgi:hypothetical protein
MEKKQLPKPLKSLRLRKEVLKPLKTTELGRVNGGLAPIADPWDTVQNCA